MSTLQIPEWGEKQVHPGDFVRQDTVFRRWVSLDQTSEFPLVPNRYHLYVCYACPWSHRTLIARKLKGLESVIPFTYVSPLRDSRGWTFTEDVPDPNGHSFVREMYVETLPSYSLRPTVPVLYDTLSKQIVNNHDDDICRMFNSIFSTLVESSTPTVDLCPPDLEPEISALNVFLYENVNNGVYRCGFARTQESYDYRVRLLFRALDWLDGVLSTRRFLLNTEFPTESDWYLFVCLLRFDPVYYIHFKCCLQHIFEYECLFGWLKDLFQVEGVEETVNMEHIKKHYYMTHPSINPKRFVPAGPTVDLTGPDGREEL